MKIVCFLESEVQYRKSLLKNNSSNNIKFNLSDALFKQDRYDESIALLNEVISATSDSILKSESYYNMGNNLLKQQKIEEAIEAYKNCLRINSADEEARYNLSKSISLLEKQNQNNENKEDQDKNENKDEKQNQQSGETDGEDEENKDKNENKNDQNDSNQNSNSNDLNEQKNEEQQSSFEKKENELSQEEIKRILEALDREEKNVQEKMKKVNLSNKNKNIEKDW